MYCVADAVVAAIMKKYKKTLYKRKEFDLGDLTTQEVYDGLTSGGKQLEECMVGNPRNSHWYPGTRVYGSKSYSR